VHDKKPAFQVTDNKCLARVKYLTYVQLTNQIYGTFYQLIR